VYALSPDDMAVDVLGILAAVSSTKHGVEPPPVPGRFQHGIDSKHFRLFVRGKCMAISTPSTTAFRSSLLPVFHLVDDFE
jgi:hypothetical protein